MSEVTKLLHRQNYPAIDAASPEQSQAGRKVLITGASAGIGRAAAQGFVTAGADVVAITSRSAERASRAAKELEAAGQGHTKVLGYQYEVGDEGLINALWDKLDRDGIQIDVLILNAAANIPTEAETKPSISQIVEAFEHGVRNQLINIDRFQKQGPKEGKVLICVGTNAIQFNGMPLQCTLASSPRLALIRLLQDLADHTLVSDMQILIPHPGFVFTPHNATHYAKDSLPFDDESLPGNFFVWAATKKAAFLHGLFVWANWDVDELIAMKPRIEADKGFLKVGLQGVASQDFGMLLAGMARSV